MREFIIGILVICAIAITAASVILAIAFLPQAQHTVDADDKHPCKVYEWVDWEQWEVEKFC